MIPVLAHGSVLVCETTRALSVPSAASACQTKWNSSAVLQMSPPPPWMVQVPLLSTWLPTGVGLPMSAQVQPLGQAGGGGGALPLTFSVSKVAELSAAVLCELTARPASTVPLVLSATLVPMT